MAIAVVEKIQGTTFGIWNISETESDLQLQYPDEGVPTAITSPVKRLEFLSVRVLLKHLLAKQDVEFAGIVKDQFGKPYLRDNAFQISLSHSYPYVAVALSGKSVGIDLEQSKPKLLKIATRVLAPEELEHAGQDVVRHCVYWCAKETMIKFHGRKDLHFAENLRIDAFEPGSSGFLTGRIIVNNQEEAVPMHFRVYDNFVLVLSL